MGLFNGIKNFMKQQETNDNLSEILKETQNDLVYAPIKGKIIAISEIGDGVFSEEVLGKGCGIEPAEGKMFAPVSGKIMQVAQTKHAVGFLSDAGIEVLVHVGMDTVDMNGKGFSVYVKAGDYVECGQLIMDFSIEEINKASHVATTAVVITNSDDYKEIHCIHLGETINTTKILQVV